MSTFSDIEPDRLYTSEVVAALFDVTPATVRNWVRRGKLIPAGKLGCYRFFGSELLRLVGGPVLIQPETQRERQRRAERRWAEIRKGDKRSGGQGSR